MDHDAILEELKPKILAHLAGDRNFKVDTSSWNASDIKTLNHLLDERTQAVVTHYAPIPKSGKRGVAPSDLKAPNDWKYDHGTAGYFFGGTDPCALELTGKICHHPLCKRAKTKEGISLLEYDTIMHYAQRILTAKTPRMKDALRKQRDIQLLKDKEEEQEFKDKAMKKINQLGKKAGETLLEAVAKYDKYWIPPAPPEPPENAVELVGKALSSNRIKHLSSFSRTFMDVVEERVYSMEHNKDWRDCTRVVNYFRKVLVTHLEAAMMNIRDIMDIIGELTYEMDYCLRAFLEQFNAIKKHIPRKIRNGQGMRVFDVLHYALQCVEVPAVERTTFLDCDGHLYRMLQGCGLMQQSVDTAKKVDGKPPTEAIAQAIAKSPNALLTDTLMYKLGQKETSEQLLIINDTLPYEDATSLNLPVWVGDTIKYVSFSEPMDEAYDRPAFASDSIDQRDKTILERYFHQKGEGLGSFLQTARFDWQWCLPVTMLSVVAALNDVFDSNVYAGKLILRQLSSLVLDRTPDVPEGWKEGIKVIGQAVLFTYSYLVLEGTRVYGRYDVNTYAVSGVYILLMRTLLAPADKKMKDFEAALYKILRCLYMPDAYVQPHALRKLYRKISQLNINCETPLECYSSACFPDIPEIPKHALSSHTSISDVHLRHHVQGQVRVNARIWKHAGEFLQVCHRGDFNKLSAAKVLKFVSFWIRPGSHTLDQASLDLLWHLFLRAEETLKMTPGMDSVSLVKPHSLNIGMHNQCSLWELTYSNIVPFFGAFEENFRSVSADITGPCGLFGSFTEAIRQTGSTRLVEDTLDFLLEAQVIPQDVRECLELQYDYHLAYEKCIRKDAQSSVVNELDYLSNLANVGIIDRPNEALILQMIQWKPCRDVFFTQLTLLLKSLDMKEAAEDVKIQSAKLIAHAAAGESVAQDDPRLLAMVRIAQKAWDLTEHVDIVYRPLLEADLKMKAYHESDSLNVLPTGKRPMISASDADGNQISIPAELPSRIELYEGAKAAAITTGLRNKMDMPSLHRFDVFDSETSSSSSSSSSSSEASSTDPLGSRHIPELDIDIPNDEDDNAEHTLPDSTVVNLRVLPKILPVIESLQELLDGLDEHMWAVDNLFADSDDKEIAKYEYATLLKSSGNWIQRRCDEMKDYMPHPSSDETEVEGGTKDGTTGK